MRKYIIKKAKQNWKDNFEIQLNNSQKKLNPVISKYYFAEYSKVYKPFISNGAIPDLSDVFKSDEVFKIYKKIFVDVGLKFAFWYSNSFDKLLKRNDVSNHAPIWTSRFETIAIRKAKANASGVIDTAKKTIIKVLRRKLADKKFMALGEVEASKILRKELKGYSNWQSKRLIRTESHFAANFGALEAAKDMFDRENLVKQWMHSGASNERDWHREADGLIVGIDQTFNIGGEDLQFAGDGSGFNAINCRCASPSFPREDIDFVNTGEI